MLKVRHSLFLFLVTFFVMLSSIQSWAVSDLPLNFSYEDVREFEYQMEMASVPERAEHFQIDSNLLVSGAKSCVSENPNFFGPDRLSNEIARSTALDRLKKPIFYNEIRLPNDDSYFAGNPSDVTFYMCTMMILTGIEKIDEMNDTKIPISFLYKVITMPEISETVLITFFRSISDSQDLTAAYIDGLLKALFSRDDISWNLINSISDDALRSSSKMKFYLISEFLNHLYESEIFKNFKVFFSQKILTYLPHAEISKAQKTEVILNGIGHLNDELVVRSIFRSLSTWKFSQGEAMSIYTSLGSRLSDSERLSVIRQILSSYDSISDLIKRQVSLLFDSDELRRKNKEALLRAILSDAKLYEKYGMDFVEKLIKDELTELKREESTFSLMSYLVRDSKLSPQQKQSILTGLALDQSLTQKKVMDLLSSVESHLLTNNMAASELKMAVEKIMELAPKQERVGDFLRRLIIHTPYAGEMTDSMTRELIKNFKISTSDAQTLIMDYYSFDSPSAPSIIDALVRKNEITADIGKVIAAIPNNLASDERYKGLLEYVMNHSNTGESAKRTIRYKLTGEIPTLENIPTLNWDLPEKK